MEDEDFKGCLGFIVLIILAWLTFNKSNCSNHGYGGYNRVKTPTEVEYGGNDVSYPEIQEETPAIEDEPVYSSDDSQEEDEREEDDYQSESGEESADSIRGNSFDEITDIRDDL